MILEVRREAATSRIAWCPARPRHFTPARSSRGVERLSNTSEFRSEEGMPVFLVVVVFPRVYPSFDGGCCPPMRFFAFAPPNFPKSSTPETRSGERYGDPRSLQSIRVVVEK